MIRMDQATATSKSLFVPYFSTTAQLIRVFFSFFNIFVFLFAVAYFVHYCISLAWMAFVHS